MIEIVLLLFGIHIFALTAYLYWDHRAGVEKGEDLVRAVRRGGVPPTAEEYEREAAWAVIDAHLDAARLADRERLLVRRMEERLRAEGERTARDG